MRKLRNLKKVKVSQSESQSVCMSRDMIDVGMIVCDWIDPCVCGYQGNGLNI